MHEITQTAQVSTFGVYVALVCGVLGSIGMAYGKYQDSKRKK
jgi:hypothetical protein